MMTAEDYDREITALRIDQRAWQNRLENAICTELRALGDAETAETIIVEAREHIHAARP